MEKISTEKEILCELIQQIRARGNLRDIVSNEKEIIKILASPSVLLTKAFFIVVNEEINSGRLFGDELILFRKGRVMDLIVNLQETVNKVKPRKLHKDERMLKIAYVGIIKDRATIVVSFTHRKIILAITGKSKDPNASDLTGWINSPAIYQILPIEIQKLITIESLHRGIPKVKEIVESVAFELQKNPAINTRRY